MEIKHTSPQTKTHVSTCFASMCPHDRMHVSLYFIFVLGDDEDNKSDDDTNGTDEATQLFGSSEDESADDEASTSVSLLFF